MDEPSTEVLAERERVLEIIDAHKDALGLLYVRLRNLISQGADLGAEIDNSPKDRPFGFKWPI